VQLMKGTRSRRGERRVLRAVLWGGERGVGVAYGVLGWFEKSVGGIDE